MALENIVVPHPTAAGLSRSGSGWCTDSAFPTACATRCNSPGASADVAAGLNIGIELGQLLVLVVLVPTLNLLFRYVVRAHGSIILSAIVATRRGTGWDRWDVLRQFPFPAITAAGLRWH